MGPRFRWRIGEHSTFEQLEFLRMVYALIVCKY